MMTVLEKEYEIFWKKMMLCPPGIRDAKPMEQVLNWTSTRSLSLAQLDRQKMNFMLFSKIGGSSIKARDHLLYNFTRLCFKFPHNVLKKAKWLMVMSKVCTSLFSLKASYILRIYIACSNFFYLTIFVFGFSKNIFFYITKPISCYVTSLMNKMG